MNEQRQITAKEEADELVAKFKHEIEYNCQPSIVDAVAAKCAKLLVMEILYAIKTIDEYGPDYWEYVKRELEKKQP